jgi:hypothetical protein
MIEAFLAPFQNNIIWRIWGIAWLLAPIWGPIVLSLAFWRLWVVYTFFWQEMRHKHIVLQIKLPQEILKTPLAMEMVLMTLHQTSGETTVLDRIWFGKRRTWFSLEMASIEGQVYFFIWTRAFFRNMVEAAFYSQYPEVEIHEVFDYSLNFDLKDGKNIIWGCEFDFNKPDAYPIKTYIDYGCDKPTDKPELTSDPITPLIEFLGSARKGHQVWIQFIIQSHKAERTKSGTWLHRTDWREEAGALVDKILKRDPKTKTPVSKVGDFTFGPVLTDEEKKAAESIMRSINKQAFNVGIRGLYISEPESFDAIFIVGLLSCLKQFSTMELNGFHAARGHYIFSWPWQFENFRSPWISRRLLRYYRQRAFFHPPYKQKAMVMTTEEIATLFHPPSSSLATTPTFGRILSKRAKPPTNLPI